jgi:yeast amino acid transporter
MSWSAWLRMYAPCEVPLTLDWGKDAFRSYLVDGPVGHLAGFWACCCNAIYAYVGTDLLESACKTERQRESIPRIVRRVWNRIMFCYVGAVFVLGLNVSANDPILESYITNPNSSYSSPFVLMIRRAGIPILPHLINVVALMAVISVAIADLEYTVHSMLRFANK